MKNFLKIMAKVGVASMLLSSCGGGSNNQPQQPSNVESDSTESVKEFVLGNGVNVSHWLSQSTDRGEARANKITKKDFDSIAKMGFKHVRLPIDEEQFYDEQGNRLEDGFQLLHNAINWTIENGMNIIVDVHIIRSHHFNHENLAPNTLFSDPKSQDNFINLWLNVQKELKKYPNDRLAYEIMNEPVAPNCELWNQLVDRYIKTIRQTEPDRKLVIGSNFWQTVPAFDSLRVPENDKNLILSFHFYEPNLVTHYRAPWTGQKDYDGKIQYPGMIIEDTTIYSKLSEKLRARLQELNGDWSKEKMEEYLQPALKKAENLGLQLYCGEFGVYPVYVDKDIRFRWYEDIISIFRKYNIANAHWCYKGDFPIVKEDGSANELPAILTK